MPPNGAGTAAAPRGSMADGMSRCWMNRSLTVWAAEAKAASTASSLGWSGQV